MAASHLLKENPAIAAVVDRLLAAQSKERESVRAYHAQLTTLEAEAQARLVGSVMTATHGDHAGEEFTVESVAVDSSAFYAWPWLDIRGPLVSAYGKRKTEGVAELDLRFRAIDSPDGSTRPGFISAPFDAPDVLEAYARASLRADAALAESRSAQRALLADVSLKEAAIASCPYKVGDIVHTRHFLGLVRRTFLVDKVYPEVMSARTADAPFFLCWSATGYRVKASGTPHKAGERPREFRRLGALT